MCPCPSWSTTSTGHRSSTHGVFVAGSPAFSSMRTRRSCPAALGRRPGDAREDRRRRVVPTESGGRFLESGTRHRCQRRHRVTRRIPRARGLGCSGFGNSCNAAYRKPNLAIGDFIAPARSLPEGLFDHIGAFVVTAGPQEIAIAERFEAEGDDYSSILVKSLADRIAEALAEYMHARVRRELWGYAPDEAFEPGELLAEPYRGVRPAPGYPAQPDHSEKETFSSCSTRPIRSVWNSPTGTPCGPAPRCVACTSPTPSRHISQSAEYNWTKWKATPQEKASQRKPGRKTAGHHPRLPGGTRVTDGARRHSSWSRQPDVSQGLPTRPRSGPT